MGLRRGRKGRNHIVIFGAGQGEVASVRCPWSRTTAWSSPRAPRRRTASRQKARLAKLDALRRAGTDPYPYRFDRTHTLGELRARYADLEPGAETEDRVRVAGRLMLLRRQGKLTFATMRDRTGELQLFAARSVMGESAHEEFDRLDLGDWVGAEGTVMVTRKESCP